MHKPNAAPAVLGAEWLMGATTVPAIEAAKNFSRLDSVPISAIIDKQDMEGSPATDNERLTKTMPAALAVQDEQYLWRTGANAQAQMVTLDGRQMPAEVFSPYDILVLANETRAREAGFRLAVGESSSRRLGKPLPTEIIMEWFGEDHAEQPLQIRQAVVLSGGQMPLSGLGVAMALEQLVGPTSPARSLFPIPTLEVRKLPASINVYWGRAPQIGRGSLRSTFE